MHSLIATDCAQYYMHEFEDILYSACFVTATRSLALKVKKRQKKNSVYIASKLITKFKVQSSKFHWKSPCEHDRKHKEITNQKGRKMLLNLERISTCKFLNRSMSSALSMIESPRCRYCLCFARMWSRTDSSSGSRVALHS